MGLLGRAVPPWPPSQVHNPTASPPASPGALAVAHRAGTFSLWRASVKNGLVSNGTSFLTSLIRGYWWYHKGGGRQESCFSSLVQLSWELMDMEPVPRQPSSLLGSEEVTHIQPQAAPVAWSHQKITNLIFHSSLQIRIARRATLRSPAPAMPCFSTMASLDDRGSLPAASRWGLLMSKNSSSRSQLPVLSQHILWPPQHHEFTWARGPPSSRRTPDPFTQQHSWALLFFPRQLHRLAVYLSRLHPTEAAGPQAVTDA